MAGNGLLQDQRISHARPQSSEDVPSQKLGQLTLCLEAAEEPAALGSEATFRHVLADNKFVPDSFDRVMVFG
jgi:hypothetical protein